MSRRLQDRFHLIGIGGAGMSVVAELLASRGATVGGLGPRGVCCARAPALRRAYASFVGHEASHVDPGARWSWSRAAIREDNPELAIARDARPAASFTAPRRSLWRRRACVSSASPARTGETTTSVNRSPSRLAACGLDPSVAVGGVLPQLGTGAHLGGGDVFVAEADESDGSFLNYTPAIEIVTNVEPDHLDRYHSREEFEQIFVEFARRMVPGGLLVTCAEDEGAVRLAPSARAEGPASRDLRSRRACRCAPPTS